MINQIIAFFGLMSDGSQNISIKGQMNDIAIAAAVIGDQRLMNCMDRFSINVQDKMCRDIYITVKKDLEMKVASK